MQINPTNKPHICFLYCNTGGGHRSAAKAIIEAINLEYPDQYDSSMVDVFRDFIPPPYDIAHEIYPMLTKTPTIWEAGFKLSNTQNRKKFLGTMAWPYVKNGFKKMIRENPSDLYISVHPLLNFGTLQALEDSSVPFVTVVTDMVTAHSFWFDPRADLIIVPTQAARKVGLDEGIDPQKIVTVGQPVADKFCLSSGDKKAVRHQLGLPDNKPVILLVGGGDGMGPLKKSALAIDAADFPVHLVIICGRNEQLKESLENHNWKTPASIVGFTENMPDYMSAADVLVTKAGPGTISEAFIAGLPLILYSKVPGQEDGNVEYVIEKEAGVWAPEPEQVIDTLKKWINNPEELALAAEASRRCGRPNATRKIARLVVDQIKTKNFQTI